MELPLEVPEDAMEAKEYKLENLKILVVDDDVNTCTHASLLLKKMGIDADWVQHGSEAVQMVRKAHEAYCDYDVCLIDWKMPDMDGIEVTRRIREELGTDTLIIIISAYDWSDIKGEARKAGVNAFVAKPLFESSLYQTLSSVISSDSDVKEESICSTPLLSGKRILLAEDNELNREIAVELLKETCAKIDCAENGKEAVERFATSPSGYYNIILMDIQMPVMGGYEATRHIRSSHHADALNIPILAMTANAFREDEEEALASGMNGHIAKPIDVNLLYGTVSELIKKQHSLSSDKRRI